MIKIGTENPSTAKIITDRSIHVPDFHAARTPNGTATSTAKIIVVVASANVGSIRCPISLVTGTLEKMLMPRSP